MTIDRLASFETFRALRPQELEWLAARGTMRTLAPGDFLVRIGDPAAQQHFYIILAGAISTYVQREGVQRKLSQTRAGGFLGRLPFSRMTYAVADLIVDEPVELMQVDNTLFAEMIRECPALTAACVHSMIDRSHVLTESDLHDEKMFSLGKLAAGLAHELNNPASAALSSAQALKGAQEAMSLAADALADAEIAPAHRAAIRAVMHRGDGGLGSTDPIERADREDAIVEWLEARGADLVAAALLADSGLGVGDLQLLETLPRPAIAPAVAWIAARLGARALTSEIDRAARRVHDLVAAVREFTQMDRPLVVEAIAIGPGVRDTMSVLEPRARNRSVAIDVDVAADLPLVRASVAELNQVWANLLDNAIDAAPPGSRVTIAAAPVNGAVIVRVIDEGAGIPDAIRGRIFDPFFTTKPVGQGRGLGLDIARRIVRLVGGQIDVVSQPGRTEFQVSLPAITQLSLS